MIRISDLQAAFESVTLKKPLVLCLTNVVTMDFMANCLLAINASPLMSQSDDEIAELLAISQALVINPGTLDDAFARRAQYAAKLAEQKGIPVVLDPVGAGASQIRTELAQALLPWASIIRGNASEIVAIANGNAHTRGVDNNSPLMAALEAAQSIVDLQKTVVISGSTDVVKQSKHIEYVPFGSPLMSKVTGMGCALTAVIAAFAGSGLPYYQAALYATVYFALSGQLAASIAAAPGSFRQLFIDTLYQPDWQQLESILLP